jgi:phosphoribosylformimino-5-aminoimidazole carboxamide ribotide isomerase
MIVIPAIDIIEGKAVRLTQGEKDTRKIYDVDPVAVAARWAEAGAKRIHVVDLDGAFDGASKNVATISEIARTVAVPIQVGGGIRTAAAVEALIKAGVDRVVIGTIVVENPSLASDIIEAFPGRVCIGIDARAGMVATHGWVKTSERTIDEILERAAEWRAAAVIFTAIERDGELVGPDFDAIEDVAGKSLVPVIASGGVSRIDDLRRLARIPRLEGAIVGKALYEGRIDLREALSI